MNRVSKAFKDAVGRIADVALAPLVLPAALVMKLVRRLGVERLPLSSSLFRTVGVFPIRNHYYEPRFDFRQLDRPLDERRPLPGIDLRITDQLELLQSFRWKTEFDDLDNRTIDGIPFIRDNVMFCGADAAFYYNLIRLKKPRRIIEVGSGQSTLVALAAIAANASDASEHPCDLLCVEPYETPWLSGTSARILRQRVETLDPAIFTSLVAGDILFIDSSHVIRPQGDLTFLFLEILPSLAKGVIVHVHDIFTPRDYPAHWLSDRVWLWNEQYLLEALISGGGWQVLAALNKLSCDYRPELAKAFGNHNSPSEPASFYMVKL